MKKLNALLVVVSVPVFFISCKKENNAASAFAATGFWRGNFPVDVHTIPGIVNHANGTSRYYLMANRLDTAAAVLKYDGSYKVNGDVFKAEYYFDSTGYRDTVSLQAAGVTGSSMRGIIVEHGVSGSQNFAGAYNFEVIKQ